MERLSPERRRRERRFRPQGQASVLIAESDRVLGDLYRGALQPSGWEVEVAYDGRAALDRIIAAPPDVLLLDSLPDYGPVDFVERVRQHQQTRDLAVIMLLDTVDHVDLRRLEELGVLAWLIKNRITRTTLNETITRLLEDRNHQEGERDQS